MFQEFISHVLCPIQIEQETKWYIQELEFIGEETPITSLDDEMIESDNNDNTHSTRHPTF